MGSTENATIKTPSAFDLAKQNKKAKQKKAFTLFFMALPFLALVFVFAYLPLYGWIYAFYNFIPGIPLSDTPWVGFQWFQSLVSDSARIQEIVRIMTNTFAISSLGIVTSIFPVIFAIFLVEIKNETFKKFVQVLTTLPNFISWVLVYSFAYALFATDSGMVNQLFTSLGLIQDKINFLANDDLTWIKMTAWSLWKFLGWNSIMYLATITSIDQEMYEAAKVDGAGRFRTMWAITVPHLLPTYFVLLLLQVANFVNNGMDQYFVFQNAMNKEHIEVLDLYVYNISFTGASFSFGTAVSMLKSIISLVLLFGVNQLSKSVRGESII